MSRNGADSTIPAFPIATSSGSIVASAAATVWSDYWSRRLSGPAPARRLEGGTLPLGTGAGMTDATTIPRRASIDVDGASASYLTAGDGPLVLLLHGTYWSRVWQPVIPTLATRGLRPVAVDLPGCGRSGGELTLERATVPELTAWVDRFLDALGAE